MAEPDLGVEIDPYEPLLVWGDANRRAGSGIHHFKKVFLLVLSLDLIKQKRSSFAVASYRSRGNGRVQVSHPPLLLLVLRVPKPHR